MADDSGAFELWEGPSGFRADAFSKAIFRLIAPIPPRRKTR